MSVAVTGASGYVGRHVLAALEGRGVVPTITVRPGSDRSWVPSGAEVVELDVLDPGADAYARLGNPSVLIHLAWGGLPNYGSSHHLERELPGHRAFLEGIVAAGLPALAVAGTCLEYGLRDGQLREDMPARPVTVYGRAKDELRRALETMRLERGFALTWARLFYVFGPGQAPGSLLPQLEAAIARGDPTFPMSGGEQIRDFVPVGDAARDLVTLALGGRDNGIVNICSGTPVSVRAFVERVVARHGSPIRLELGRYPYPAYEPMAFWGDRRKLDACLEAAA